MKQLFIFCLVCMAAGFFYSAVNDSMEKGLQTPVPSDKKAFYHNYLDARIEKNRQQLKKMEDQMKQLRRQIQYKSQLLSHIEKNRNRLADEMAGNLFHYRPDKADSFLAMDFNVHHPEAMVLNINE